MNKTTMALSAAAAALLCFSGIAGWSLARHGSQLDQLGAQLAEVGRRIDTLPAQVSDSATSLRTSQDQLASRMRQVEAQLQQRSVARQTREPMAGNAREADTRTTTADTAEAVRDLEQQAELESVLAAITAPDFDWDAGSEDLGTFFRLAKDNPFLDDKIAELEAALDASPGAVDARMELANFYVGKLLTVQGPEQGLWGSKAEKQWHQVRALDPDHWESRFRIGNSYAYYPDVMGKTDDAIELLEEARSVQQRSAPTPQHVQTYLSLSRMYQRKGDHEQARAVLSSGLEYHPQDAKLREALDGLD